LHFYLETSFARLPNCLRWPKAAGKKAEKQQHRWHFCVCGQSAIIMKAGGVNFALAARARREKWSDCNELGTPWWQWDLDPVAAAPGHLNNPLTWIQVSHVVSGR